MKKIITILTLSTFLFLSCGKEKTEITNNTPAIGVKVSGISADNNSPFVVERLAERQKQCPPPKNEYQGPDDFVGTTSRIQKRAHKV